MLFVGVGLFGVILYFLLENIVFIYIYVFNVGMIVFVILMIIVVLVYFLFEGEKLWLIFFIGFGVVLIGFLLIMFNGNVVLCLNLFGDIMVVGVVFVFGGYLIFMKKLSVYDYYIIELI